MTWKWSPPTALASISYKIEQVRDPASTEPSGFTSGTPKPYGKILIQRTDCSTFRVRLDDICSTY